MSSRARENADSFRCRPLRPHPTRVRRLASWAPRAGLAVLAAVLLAAPAWAAEIVDVRVGRHPTFTRVVFELSAPAGYQVERAGRSLEVTLDASSRAREIASKSVVVESVTVREGRDRAVVRIALRSDDVQVKEMLLAKPARIVLDLATPSMLARAAAARKPALPPAGKPAAESKPVEVAVAPEPEPEPAPAEPKPRIARPSPVPTAAPVAPERTPKRVARSQPRTPEAAAVPVVEPKPSAAPPAIATTLPEMEAEPGPEFSETLPPPPPAARPAKRSTPVVAKKPPKPAPMPTAPAATAEESSLPVDPMMLAVAAAGVLTVVAAAVFMRRRRRTPPEDIGPVPFGDDGMDADSAADEEFAVGRRDFATEPVPKSGLLAGPGQAPAGGLFGEETESEKEEGEMDQPMTSVGMAASEPPLGFAGEGDAGTVRLVRELERRVAQIEARLEESSEARERLERQVAAQSEELRVQRAAIARTQRALRSLSRSDEEQATEPALRDPSKPIG